MFYTIKNDELYEYSENNSNLTGEVFFTDITTQENLTKNIDAFKVVGNKLVDISTEPEYIAEQLEKAKLVKYQENTTKRDEHLLAGVTYKGIVFDSDTDQKTNLILASMGMNDTQTIVWLGKYNYPLECTKADIIAIGELIGQLTKGVWMVKNPAYIEAISNAQTIEELDNIIIDY